MQKYYKCVKIYYKDYTKSFKIINSMEVCIMKKYVVAMFLTLSLVVGLLISSPAALANAQAEKTCNLKRVSVTVPSSQKGQQSINVGTINKNEIANIINNICNGFKIDNNWINTIIERYKNSNNTTTDDSQPGKDSNTPAETPKAETPKTETPAPKTPKESQTPSGLTTEQARMLELVNQERTKAGLKPLAWDAELARVAGIKAQDMVQNNYFSHTSPTYGSPFEMMKKFGISYRTAGENLAGYNSVEGAHNGLMNSDGHRANILNSSFTHIGIGVQKSPRYGYVFVQMFVGR